MRFPCIKKLLIILFLIISSSTFSQNPYKAGDRIAQFGMGYGFYGIKGDVSTPPLSLGLQFVSVPEVSVGAIFGYTTTKNSWTSPALQYLGAPFTSIEGTYSYYMTGLRAEYHFVSDTTDFDGYFGISGGYTFVSYSHSTNVYDQYGFSADGSYGFFGIHGGIRYYFRPNFAFFGEVGYGLGYITVGIAYKWE